MQDIPYVYGIFLSFMSELIKISLFRSSTGGDSGEMS